MFDGMESMTKKQTDGKMMKGIFLILCIIAGLMVISPVSAISAEFTMVDLQGLPGIDGDSFPVGDTVKFNATDNSAILYKWTINGASFSKQVVNYTFTEPGVYTISLTTVGSDTSSVTGGKNITILKENPTIDANFSYTIDYKNWPGKITLFDQSQVGSSNIIGWYWNIDGKAVPDTQLPEVKLDIIDLWSGATIPVNLTIVTADSGLKDFVSKTIYIPKEADPKANFTWISEDLKGGQVIEKKPVKFIDLSTGYVTSYLWDFGDKTTSSLQTPNHTFNHPGIYDVTLTVSNSSKSDTKTYPVEVLYDNFYVTADANPTSGESPLHVYFTADATISDKTSEEVDNLVKDWAWSIYEGKNSTVAMIHGQDIEYTFESNGTYNASVVCTLRNGQTATNSTKPITVGTLPVADFFWEYLNDMDTCCYLVKFYDTSYPQDMIKLWAWDFGDGSTSSEQNPTHRYKTADKEYTVTLTVTGTNGVTSTKTYTVQTGEGYDKPETFKAEFTITQSGSNVPVQVLLTDTSKASDYTRKWTVSDTVLADDTLDEEIVNFDNAGTYTINLKITKANGKTSEKTETLIVSEKPKVKASYTYELLDLNDPKTFLLDASTSENAINWQWDFGDESSSGYGEEITHTFPLTGRYYYVTLTVTDIDGKKDSAETGIFTGIDEDRQ